MLLAAKKRIGVWIWRMANSWLEAATARRSELWWDLVKYFRATTRVRDGSCWMTSGAASFARRLEHAVADRSVAPPIPDAESRRNARAGRGRNGGGRAYARLIRYCPSCRRRKRGVKSRRAEAAGRSDWQAGLGIGLSVWRCGFCHGTGARNGRTRRFYLRLCECPAEDSGPRCRDLPCREFMSPVQ